MYKNFIFKKLISLPFLKRIIPSILKIINYEKVVKIHNFRLLLKSSISIERYFLINGDQYEKEQTSFLKNLVKKNEINIFFDIGANIGFYSFFAEKDCNLDKIYSFEVNNDVYSRLIKNIEINRSSINAFNLGCSDINKKAKIWYTSFSKSAGTTVLDPNDPHYAKYNEKKIKFSEGKLIKLDDMYKFENCKIYFKIDVERHEEKVILGAENLIANNKIILQVEIFPEMKAKMFVLLKRYNLSFIRNIESDYFFTNL